MKKIILLLVFLIFFAGCSEKGSSDIRQPLFSSGINVTLPLIGDPVDDYLQDMTYKGRRYTEWKSNNYIDHPEIYNLEVTGREDNYYFYNNYFLVTSLDGQIIGYEQEGLQVSDFDTPYLLFHELGDEFVALLDYEPEIIQTGEYNYYLKWETKNSYLILKTTWWDGLEDWKICLVWDCCVFKK